RDASRAERGTPYARRRLPRSHRTGPPLTTTASADDTADTGAARAARRPAPLSFTPKPGAAPASRMIIAQAAHEVRLMLRNPEQLLLTIVIPALMMVLFSGESLVAT